MRATRIGTGAGSDSVTIALTRKLTAQPVVSGTAIQLGQAVSTAASSATTLNYTFDVDKDGWVALEWQSGNWLNWKLSGPRGVEANTAIASGTWKTPMAWVPAGHYQLTLSGGSGAAAFTVFDAAHATPINADTAIAVDMGASDTYALFDVQLDTSRDIWFHGLAGASAGNAYRLFDWNGTLVASGDPATQTFTKPTIPRSGHYLLAIQKNGGGALRFGFSQTQQSATPLQVGAPNQGSFLASYQTYSCTFSTDVATEISLVDTLNTGMTFSVTNPYAAGSMATAVLRASGNKTVVALPPGTYVLQASKNYVAAVGAPIPFAFTASFSSGKVDQPADGISQASVTWSNGVPDQQIGMALEAGKSYYLATPTVLSYGSGDTINYRLLDPLGRIVSTGYYAYNVSGVKFNPVMSGNYTLQMALVRYSGLSTEGASTFVLRTGESTTQPYLLGSVVEGSLNHPADLARYQFTLTEPTQIWLNSAVGQYLATLQRTDLGNTVFSISGASSDVRMLTLAPGTYELLLSPLQVSPDKFHFQLTPVAALPTLAPGATVTASAAQGRYYAAWRIAGTAGQKLLFDAVSISGYPYEYWTLMGPDGTVAASGVGYTYSGYSIAKVSLPRDGDYVLYIGSHGGDSAPHSGSIQVLPCSEPVSDIALGTQVSGTLAAPGNVNHYHFALTEETTVVLDALSGGAYVTLNGPTGYLLGLTLRNADGDYSTLRLPAGD